MSKETQGEESLSYEQTLVFTGCVLPVPWPLLSSFHLDREFLSVAVADPLFVLTGGFSYLFIMKGVFSLDGRL